MTQESPLPAAGWYLAPDGSADRWWWDGAAWIPSEVGIPTQAPPPPEASTWPTDRAAATLQVRRAEAIASLVWPATLTRVFLILCLVLSAATVALELFGLIGVTRIITGDTAAAGDLERYNALWVVDFQLHVYAVAFAALAWVIWQYRAARAVGWYARRSPGSQVLSWIVPVVNLWFPYQNISDLWRGTGRERPRWLIVWWLLLLGDYAFVVTANELGTSATTVDVAIASTWLRIVGAVVATAAAVLAQWIVRDITKALRGAPEVDPTWQPWANPRKRSYSRPQPGHDNARRQVSTRIDG